MKKKSLIILLFIVSPLFTFSQIKKQCENIVVSTVDAINSKNTTSLSNFLSEDFEIAGQKGKIAKLVLNQLITQLNDSVIDYQILSENKQEKLVLIYETTFKKIGTKTSTFTFNSSNQLCALELFTIKVKTMKNEDAVFKKPDVNFITIPFKIVGNLISVSLKVDNISRTFLFDNGSPKTILNSHYYKLKDSTEQKRTLTNATGVNGSISEMNIVDSKSIDFYGILLKNKNMISMDLQHLEKELSIPIYGLVGYDIFKDYDLLFDYNSSSISLIDPNYTKTYIEQEFKKNKFTEIPINLEAHLASINVKIAGKNYKMGIDCGAETNILNASYFEEVKSNCSNISEENLSGADKISKKATSASISKIEINSLIFNNTKTLFSSIDHLNSGYKINLDGLLGFEILSKHKTILSYKKLKLIFIE